ncbi:hypothetical protein [Streptomyces sp. NPDC058613]|uniref:hypothetical protein n=1 Tax=unclassified Streptomyces TaxID=2593676 RepID=UPI00365A969B
MITADVQHCDSSALVTSEADYAAARATSVGPAIILAGPTAPVPGYPTYVSNS